MEPGSIWGKCGVGIVGAVEESSDEPFSSFVLTLP